MRYVRTNVKERQQNTSNSHTIYRSKEIATNIQLKIINGENKMFNKLRNSPIPIWVNLVLVMLMLFMSLQVVQFYFGHEMLAESGITIDGTPNQNILYTTAGRLVAMVGASIFVLVTQNPNQFLVVFFMSILREGQEM